MWRSSGASSPSNEPAPVTTAQPSVLLAVSARAMPVAERGSSAGGGAGPCALTAPLPPLALPVLPAVPRRNATEPLVARCGLNSAPEPPAPRSGLAGGGARAAGAAPPPPPLAFALAPLSAPLPPPPPAPLCGPAAAAPPPTATQPPPVPWLDAALPLPPPPPLRDTKPQSSARRCAARSVSRSRAPL
jgi:hypothetical protein